MSRAIGKMSFEEKDIMMYKMMANLTFDEKLKLMQRMLPSMMGDFSFKQKMQTMAIMMPIMMKDIDMSQMDTMMDTMMPTMLNMMQEKGIEMFKMMGVVCPKCTSVVTSKATDEDRLKLKEK